MKVRALVISERPEEYTGKRGLVKQRVLALQDQDKEDRFINTFDYVMSETEIEQFSGKLQDKVIDLGVTNFEPAFGGRLRGRGRIIKGS